MTPSRSTRRTRRIHHVLALTGLLMLAAPVASAATVKNGAKCTKVGQLFTVKKKRKSTDFICVKEGKRRVWRVRAAVGPAGAGAAGTGSAKPGDGPTGAASASDCDKAAYKATSTGVNNIVGCDYTTTYSELAVTSGTSVSNGQSAVGFMSMPGVANESGGALFFNHPAGMATDGTRLAIADRNNNRVLIWNSAPTANTAPNLVLGQPNFSTNNSGSALNEMNWPSDLSISASGMLMVADSSNHRILIWRTFPTTNGQAADLSLDLGDGSWPWGVWTDGTKMMVSRTEAGDVKVWNSIPAASGQTSASFTIDPDIMGTPRQISSDGTRVIIGDENSRSPLGNRGSHVWNSFPTSAA
ncbi:MAG: hypothetical protein ACO33F_01275, partial [Ilumatobacteraceae bacterium]